MLHLHRHLNFLWFLCSLLGYLADPATAEIEYNTINEDGSFQFRHANDDIGGYYHSASGTPDNTVRGRYGSRSPASGQIEETVYTAGPRGFRVNGPKIHRKMDLAQYPVLPRGSPDDPLADPFDDPSYSFSFRTPDQSRSEENDSGNRIRGLYSYLDDVGERHSVRYAAGAGTGFEISNAVPDSPSTVAYSSPLYKSHPKTRGKMAVQRGPAGSYKLIASGPDHRRAESRAPDGLVRGTYSFLDDKGVQRTVEYIAGAGIGYRVVQNRIGPGTHINPSVADFRLADPDFRLANDFGRGAGGGLGPKGGGSGSSGPSGSGGAVGSGGGGGGSGGGSGRGRTPGRPGSKEYLKPADSGRPRDQGEGDAGASDDDNLGSHDGNEGDDIGPSGSSSGSSNFNGKEDRRGFPAGSSQRGSTRYDGGGSNSQRGGGGSGGSIRTNASGSRNRNRFGSSGGSASSERGAVRGEVAGGGSSRRGGGASSEGDSGLGYLPPTGGSGTSAISGPGDNYHLNDEDVGSSLPPLVTANHRILEIDRDREWVQRHRDSTVIKNVGKWYVGLPPGQSVRAHVQNIDIVPLGGRIGLSPSEALRQDEIAELNASREH
ncbi:fibroin heavy chain [Drosophila eugracilis]|uniref:fibroin heavy chain n=1 Tax=Drosophila eugracilis TaxID=29029 RepID=UPI0007E822D5|nr:fibroin heavy chain [Drosophila eugracilis]